MCGVYYRVKSNLYESSICINGKKTYLGAYDNALDSYLTYLGALVTIENNDTLS